MHNFVNVSAFLLKSGLAQSKETPIFKALVPIVNLPSSRKLILIYSSTNSAWQPWERSLTIWHSPPNPGVSLTNQEVMPGFMKQTECLGEDGWIWTLEWKLLTLHHL